MNQLEALLNEIGAFNAQAEVYRKDIADLQTARDNIIAQAKALGIRHLKASEMLAKIKCEIVVPETGAGEREAA